MTHADLEKLLGGYAAGTLTQEERRTLFDAAIADQALFDALADEEALREVLADPACRERVLSALDEQPATVWGAFDVWLRRHSVWALAAASVAAAVVLAVVVARSRPIRLAAPAQREIAMANKPVPPPVAAPAPVQQPAVQRAEPARRAFAPPTASRDGLAANRPASPAIAASRRQLAASQASLAARLRPAEPEAVGAMEPAASAGQQFAPPPPPPAVAAAKPALPPPAAAPAGVAASKESAAVVAESEASVPSEKKDEISDAKAKGGLAFGLHYTLLRDEAEVPPYTPFPHGESARLRIEPDQSGYLYAFSGKRLLFSGPVLAGQPVLIETKPGLLHLVLLPQPDSGPLSTLLRRTREQGGIVTDISIHSR